MLNNQIRNGRTSKALNKNTLLRHLLITIFLSLSASLTGCGGGSSGGSGDTGNSNPAASNDGPENSTRAESTFAPLAVHLGYENEASATRINFPLYILASAADWLGFTEEFRQLGQLVDIWDKAQRGEEPQEETRNIPLLGADVSSFQRQIRIVRTDWEEMGEMCGYGSKGLPNNGCSFHNDLPECTIYVPTQDIYADGNVDAYHALLGHEMWHCLVGSFH